MKAGVTNVMQLTPCNFSVSFTFIKMKNELILNPDEISGHHYY